MQKWLVMFLLVSVFVTLPLSARTAEGAHELTPQNKIILVDDFDKEEDNNLLGGETEGDEEFPRTKITPQVVGWLTGIKICDDDGIFCPCRSSKQD